MALQNRFPKMPLFSPVQLISLFFRDVRRKDARTHEKHFLKLIGSEYLKLLFVYLIGKRLYFKTIQSSDAFFFNSFGDDQKKYH